MKKMLISLIIFLLLLVVFISTARAQVYFTLERPPSRLGVLYNQRNVLTHLKLVKYDTTKFLSEMGLYARVYCGKINFYDFQTTNARIGIGMSIPLHALYVGLAYDLFFNTTGSDPVINIDRIFPVSIDIGFSMEQKRIRMLMILNPCYKSDTNFNLSNFNLSCSVGLSYRLKK